MRVLLASLMVSALVACSPAPNTPPSATPQPTTFPTPGCPNIGWPPYAVGMPTGLTIALTSGTSVRLSNTTSRDWTVRAEWWADEMCFGWTQYSTTLASLNAGASKTMTVEETGSGAAFRSRIGIAFWDHPCAQDCQDPPSGFGWVEVPGPSPSG